MSVLFVTVFAGSMKVPIALRHCQGQRLPCRSCVEIGGSSSSGDSILVAHPFSFKCAVRASLFTVGAGHGFDNLKC